MKGNSMTEFGYWMSSEEHTPNDLIHHAQAAEAAGFSFAMLSDHYHPWIDRQGHSPFIWAVLGALAHTTRRLRFGTGVTCPTTRIHPAILAQATATIAAMMPGRFFFGVGSGERLNEHILGDHWPTVAVRQAMLEEAIAVIRLLWQGGLQSHQGCYYRVENARLYTLPDEPPPLLVAASGPEAAELAARAGDGLIAVMAKPKLVQAFTTAGGRNKPRYGKVTLCWAPTEAEARRTVHTIWPTAALEGAIMSELPLPEHFEEAAKLVTEEHVAQAVVCGPDPEAHLAAIKKFSEAGFDHISLHQVGPDQAGFLRFWERELSPKLQATQE